jgi:xyloglucan-specific endo-beta-1,4-glucanase
MNTRSSLRQSPFNTSSLSGLVFLAAAAGMSFSSMPAAAATCTPTGSYQFLYPSDTMFEITNNPYGDESSTTDGSCVLLSSISASDNVAWYTQWTQSESNNYDVYAYPEIIFPGGSVSSGLPAQLSGISSIPSTWQYTLVSSVSNGYDVAYDLWVYNNSAGTGTPTEVMIWTNATFGQDGTDVGSFSAGGLSFTLYQTLPADYSWTNHPVYTFVSTTQESSVGFDLHAFLWHLVDAGYISSSDYLTSVDAGIEIRNGTGSLTTTEYFTYVNLN